MPVQQEPAFHEAKKLKKSRLEAMFSRIGLYFRKIIMSVVNPNDMQIIIPQNSVFEYGFGKLRLYTCKQDIVTCVKNPYLAFEMQNKCYLVSKKSDLANYSKSALQIIQTTGSNGKKIRVTQLENLAADDTELCLKDQYEIRCKHLKICADNDLYFWRITVTATSEYQYEPIPNFQLLDHKIQLEPALNIISSEFTHQLKRSLTILANTMVTFSDNVCYQTCHNITLCTVNSIIGCHSPFNKFHPNGEIRELCCNPFQNGTIMPHKIWLKHEGVEFQVDAEFFAKKITMCDLHSNGNLCVQMNEGKLIPHNTISWQKNSAQENYQLSMLWNKIKKLASGSPSSVFRDKVEALCPYRASTEEAKILFRGLIVVMGDPETYRDIYHEVVESDVEIAIKYGQIKMLKYFFQQSDALSKNINHYIQLAKRDNQASVLEYLTSVPEYIKFQKQEIIEYVADLESRCQILYGMLDKIKAQS